MTDHAEGYAHRRWDVDAPSAGPPLEAFASVFNVYETRTDGETLLYYGEPTVGPEQLEQRVWPLFRDRGYEVRLQVEGGEHVLVAEPKSIGVDGIPWTNIVFAVLTVGTTLLAGAGWYGVSLTDPLAVLRSWPFALSVLGVLGIHEFGHYALSRYHQVDASLPYFIPVPTVFGTMGAVIKMKGRIPDREALFDIGVAGPLAGLIAAIGATAVGLLLGPVEAAGPILRIEGLNYPPLVQLIAVLTGTQLSYADPALRVHPVVVGGWVGMFVTFLNLLPVGQLDGGHITRAMLGSRQETLAALVPLVLFGLGAYLAFVREIALEAVFLWFFWGVIAIGLAYAGPAHPVTDEPLDRKRIALGTVTLLLGLLCFTPVPFDLAPF
jgi:membrane-associated protease RseP (regulator of RpoE activity)